MRALDTAAIGIARGASALEGAAGRIAKRSVEAQASPPREEGDLAADMVTLSVASAQIAANVTVARTTAETQKKLLDVLA